MNAVLNIQVRVTAEQALNSVKSIESEIKRLQKVVDEANGKSSSSNLFAGAGAGMRMAGKNMLDFGKNVQWTGRQLEYSFTLPIVAAGAASTKWALDNERALTNVRKVYGDFGMSMEQRNTEVNQLAKSFELLSDKYGVNQREVIETGAAWAQAGASGVGLARSVEATMQAMIIGEMNSTEATTGLIAVQSAYNLSSQQLLDVLADLNAVENQTAIDMPGLIDVITRAGGTAKTAGISIQELAAMAAALVPAAGSAAQAGNALRTMISRIMAPTSDAADLMAKMGINVQDFAWQSKNGEERIKMLASRFMGLSDAQKTVVSASIASRWQINRFDLLMEQVDSNTRKGADGVGYYTDALEAMADHSKAAAQYQRELQTVLKSNPKAFDILINTLKNTLTTAIQPLIPNLIALLSHVVRLAQAFGKLSPETQQFVMVCLALLAVLGPVMRYIGVTSQLLGLMFNATGLALQGIGYLTTALVFLGKNALQLVWRYLLFVIGSLRAHGAASRLAAAEQAAATASMSTGWAKTAAAATVAAKETQTAQVQTAVRTNRIWSDYTSNAVQQPRRIQAQWFASLVNITEANKAAARSSFIFWEQGAAGFAATQRTINGQVIAGNAAMAASASAGAAANIGAATRSQRAWGKFAGSMRGIGATIFAIFDALLLGIPGLFFRMVGAVGRLLISGFAIVFRSLGAVLIRLLAPVITIAAEAGVAIAGAFTAPVWIIIAVVAAILLAVAALLHKFYDGGIKGFVIDVAHAFAQLPRIVSNALMATVRAMLAPIKAIINLLSYLNPFQRHSPSLVDNVTNGVNVILAQYSRLKGVGQNLVGVIAALDAFNNSTSAAKNNLATTQLQALRVDVTNAAPNAGGAFDALVSELDGLRPRLSYIQDEIDAQQNVVNKWKSALDDANDALDRQNDLLDSLKQAEESYKDSLDAAQQVLDRLTDTPIQGLGAMEDKIFDNEQAQKKLRLEILKMQGDNSFQDVADQASKLQGEIEKLQGEATDLRLGGAGSEILGPINAQIQAMKDAQTALGAGGDTTGINALQKQLDALQNEGEKLDLEKSLQFDPLQRQIDKVTTSLTEMPFDELFKKIVDQQGVVKDLTADWKQASDAVTTQQAVVDQAQAKRDDLQKTFDAENKTLQDLQDAYDAVTKAIQDGESALNDFASSAKQARDAKDALDKQSTNEQLFDAGAGANFGDVGGSSGIGREDDISIPDYNDALQKQVDEALKGMGTADMFKPLKDAWKTTKKWFGENVTMDNFKGGLKAVWNEVSDDFSKWVGKPVAKKWDEMWGGITGGAKNAWNTIKRDAQGAWNGMWDGLGSGASSAWDSVKGAADRAWTWIRDNVFTPIQNWINTNIVPAWNGFKEAVSTAWTAIQTAADTAWTWLRDNVFQPIYDFINTYLVPIFQMLRAVVEIAWWGIQTAIDAVWQWILKNVFEPIEDWIDNHLRRAWKDLKTDASDTWDTTKSKADEVWTWLKKNVFEPVEDWIDNHIRRAWKDLKTDARDAWDGLKTKADEVWTWLLKNVFQPIEDWIDNHVRRAWKDLKTDAVDAWDGIKTKADEVWKWLKENVFNPMNSFINETLIPTFQSLETKLGTVWENIKTAANTAFGGIMSNLKRDINSVINGFNTIADKLNEVGGNVPGYHNIGHIPTLAQGGVVPPGVPIANAAGGMYNTVRAIVGEGSNQYPEFVIPTDPRYRRNATALLKQANLRLLAEGGTVGANGGSGTLVPASRRSGSTNNFYGDLIFPNVEDGDDAEDFISNLEKLG